MRHMQPTRQSGFTVVEMIIVIAIIPIILVIFSTIFVNASIDSLRSNAKTGLSIQAMRSLNFIEQSVKTSREFLETTPTNYSDPFASTSGSSSSWSFRGKSADSRVLILDQYATTSNALSLHRLPVYKKDAPYSCSDPTRKLYNEKIHYLNVFFVKDKVLYRRTLTDRVSTPCPDDVQAQKQSCPPDNLSSNNCYDKVRDEILATGVDSFSVKYYDVDATLDNAYDSSGIIKAADKVEVTIKLSDENKKNINGSFSQIMTKGNV